VAGRQGEGAFGLGQLAVRSTVLAQSVRGRLVEGDAISLVAQLLQIANERL
jgi:hypothetical protein